ncbi:MAG: hypothetical protein U0892_04485 [Pirellulales bacterium]
MSTLSCLASLLASASCAGMRCVLLMTILIAAGLQSASAADLTAEREALTSLPEPKQADWLVTKVQRPAGLYRGRADDEIVLDNGIVRRTFMIAPNTACIGLEHLQSQQAFVRTIRPEATISLNGKSVDVGGLKGAPIGNFFRPEWKSKLTSDPAAFQLKHFEARPMTARLEWKPRLEWISNPTSWPPKGIEVRFEYAPPAERADLAGVELTIHYEMFDGLPLMCKWLSLVNRSGKAIHIDTFTSESLAVVEASSQVEDLAEPTLPNLHVETDFTSCSMHGASSQRDAVHWSADPSYSTQVNYRLQSKVLLECRPSIGPDIDVAPGETFESFRTWMLVYDSRDETRQMLSLNHMYRTVAPWSTENPIIHHVRSASHDAVKLAVDQAAEVGFELVIMTFGSGFNIENNRPEYLKTQRSLVETAHAKNVALGGYSLLASRSVGPKDDVVNPATGKPGGFARFGNSPCLESEWGRTYFDKLYAFYDQTGADCLEHDGSYPGDECASNDHPGHKGHGDSRWRQWQKITAYYKWCRSRGIYLNVPDWYYLSGSNKNGMGYRETNWSLPRDYQEIIERQNIADGTRYKLPTMGWMFVPLTEYHGGGAEATIEPLDGHIDHYRRRLQNLFGAGVQACFRGPRIYDTPAVRDMVKQQVDFYKRHRAILDSSLIVLRRADGRDWDGWLHVNPELEVPGLAVIYNSTADKIEREISVPLYYTGLTERAEVRIDEGTWQSVKLNRREEATIPVSIASQSSVVIEFRAGR